MEEIHETLMDYRTPMSFGKERQLPRSLYHYTTGPGFLGIIKDKKIWATSIHYMNDSKEFVLAFEIARREIQKIRENKKETIILDYMVEKIKHAENVNICVASFSEKKDQLSQWRAYSGDYGFSLGFPSDHLKTMAIDQGFILAPCIYNSKEQDDIVKKVIDLHIEEFHKKAIGGHVDEICKEVSSMFINNLVLYSSIIKHSSFKEECEWRLISQYLSAKHRQMDYRSGKSMIIPGFKFNLCKNKELLKLDDITVGPTPHTDIAKRAVSGALTKYTVNCLYINSSSTPYRNW